MQAQRLNDEVFEALATRGYVIVHNYLPEAQRAEMAAALRRILKPWDEIADDPPDHPYYTRQTLAALEAQYPGWNVRGEYRPRDGE